MSESPSPQPAIETEDRTNPKRSASPSADVKEGRQDALAGMFDDFPAQTSTAAGSPARSTTNSPVKRKRSLSETSSRSSRSGIGSDDEEAKTRNRMEYADEENAGQGEDFQAISSVVLPKFPKLASSDGQVWALKLPSAISFPGQPFHPDLYRAEQGPIQEEEDAEDDTDEKRKLRALKRMHAVTNTVRWKWVSGTHGETVRRSNSRVIRWSDGTASLMIGQEMWDLQTEGVTSGFAAADKASIKPFALGNEVNQEPQSQPKPAVKEEQTAKRSTREGPVSLLLSTDYDNSVLVADSLVTGTLSLVPLTRNVRDHPKRLGAIDKSTFKASKILHYHDTSGIRPDKQIEDKVKEMQEQQKKRMKARGHDLNAGLSLPVWKGSSGGGGARADRGDREGSPLGGGTSGGGKKRGGGRRTRTSYSSDEDMDGDGGRGAGGYGGGDYESDDFVVDDDEDEDLGRGERSESEASQAESNGLSALDRDLNRAADEETRRRREDKKNHKSKRDKKSSRDYDSDEDGDDDGDFGARKSKARESDDEDINMLEKAAERVTQAEKKEKKDRKRREQEASTKNDSIDADDLLDDEKGASAMDVDDEDIQIDGSQVIRKRVLQYDDEDDE